MALEGCARVPRDVRPGACSSCSKVPMAPASRYRHACWPSACGPVALTVTETREPGGTPLGEQIRHILLDPADVPRGPVADALLFNAARSQLVADVILPALARGEIVVLTATPPPAWPTRATAAAWTAACSRHRRAIHARPAAGPGAGAGRAGGGRAWPGGTGHAAELTRFEDAARHDLAFHERVRDGLPGDGRGRPRALGRARRQRRARGGGGRGQSHRGRRPPGADRHRVALRPAN